jgi:hypothetical protein
MKKSEQQEKVLEELANGELVTVLCRRDDMPSLNTLQRWRRKENEFDDKCWSAEAQGVMIKRSSYIEQMEEAIAEGGPGSAIKMQGLRELLNENTRTAGRLVSRMSDRVSVDNSVKHYVISWANDGAKSINGTPRQYTDIPSTHSKEITHDG